MYGVWNDNDILVARKPHFQFKSMVNICYDPKEQPQESPMIVSVL